MDRIDDLQEWLDTWAVEGADAISLTDESEEDSLLVSWCDYPGPSGM